LLFVSLFVLIFYVFLFDVVFFWSVEESIVVIFYTSLILNNWVLDSRIRYLKLRLIEIEEILVLLASF
jgi:hypothetical protein